MPATGQVILDLAKGTSSTIGMPPAGMAAQCVCGGVLLHRRPAAFGTCARPVLTRCQSHEPGCSHRELDSPSVRQAAVQRSRRACNDIRELAGTAASQHARDLLLCVRSSGTEPGEARHEALQLSRRACGLALGASLLALQAGPAHAVLTAPQGACESMLALSLLPCERHGILFYWKASNAVLTAPLCACFLC